MPTDRDTYKYHFKVGNRIVHTGITNDIDRREGEHKNEPQWDTGAYRASGCAHHPRSLS